MSIESLQQSVAANTAWINAVTTSSKLPAQLIELLSISNLNQKFTVQEGVLDAKVVDAPTLRGYKGNWAADSNSPLLSNTSGIVGDIYRVNIAGTLNIGSGSISYVVGDLIYRSATNWVKVSPNQISDITGLQSALDNLAGGLMAQGNWNALINSPDISGTTQTGYFWIVDTAGATDLGGITDWELNDWAVKTASGWAKIDNSDKVISVAGRTGVITLAMSDVSGLVSALATTVKITGDQSIAGLKTFSNTLNTAAINLSGSSAITIPNYIKHTGEATTNYFGFPGEKNFSVVTNSTTKFFASDTSAILYSLGNAKLTTQTYGVEVLGNIVNTGGVSTDGIVVSNPLSGSFFQSKLELRRVGVLGGVKIVSDRNNAGGVGLLIQVTANNTAETNGTYSTALSIGRDAIATFTSVPIVGTRASGDNTTRAASTAFVTAATGAVPIGDYLPLTGGTLTGNLVGTNATFSSTSQILNLNSTNNGGVYMAFKRSNTRIGYVGFGSSGVNLTFANELVGNVLLSNPRNSLTIATNGVSTFSSVDIGGSPAATAILQVNGFEGRAAGIKIRDNVNNATSPSNREWFVGTGYSTSSFNIGYAADGSQSSYAANTKFLVTTAGKVGIGVTLPISKLHVSSGASIEATLTIGASGTGNDKSSKLFFNEGEFGVTDSEDYGFSLAYDGSAIAYPGLAGNEFGIIRHNNSANGDVVMKMTRTSDNVIFNGNVGITGTSPTFKLDIGTNLNSNNVFRINGLHSRVLLSGTVNAPTDGVGMWNFINHAGTNALTRFYVQDANNVDARLTFRFTGNGGSNEILSGSSTGNVGIGTITPLANLHVNDVIPRIRLSSTTTGTSDEATVGAIDFYTSDSSSEGQNVNAKIEGFSDDIYGRMGLRFFTGGEGYVDERMRISHGGNVGITSDNPNSKLTVGGNVVTTLKPTAVISDTTNGGSLVLRGVSPILSFDKTGTGVPKILMDGGGVQFKTGNLDSEGDIDMVILSNGNVGIGKDTPTTKLNLGGSGSDTTLGLSITNSDGANMHFRKKSGFNNALEIVNVNNDINIITGTTSRIYVDASTANVGIGTTTPGTKFEVIGGQDYRTLNIGETQVNFSTKRSGITATHWQTTEQNIAMINTFSDNSNTVLTLGGGISTLNAVEDIRFFTALSNTTTSGTVRMTIKGNGYVGINDILPDYHLDVNGTIRATGDVIAYSDARVKENVVTIDNALDKVDKLRGVTYTRNDIEDKETKMGVIAQEVIKVIPEVVQKDKDGRYSVAYGNMNGLLIEAIKELKAEIEQLKSKI